MARHVHKGSRDIDYLTPEIRTPFRPVALRIHFVGDGFAGVADVVISLEAAEGDEYNVTLLSITGRGVGADMNLIWSPEELTPPCGWTFGAGDRLRIRWSNPHPDNVSWGLRFETASVLKSGAVAWS